MVLKKNDYIRRLFGLCLVASVLIACANGNGVVPAPEQPVPMPPPPPPATPPAPIPPATQLTIGGSIVGLGNIDGLVLSSGTGEVIVSAGASTFIMPGTLDEGNSYDITVKAQPLEVVESGVAPAAKVSCTTANGKGIVGRSNVTSVKIVCHGTIKFSQSGTSTWTVPPGVQTISAVATGGGGGGGGGAYYSGGNGGHGGVVSASGLSVTPEKTLSIQVGRGGSGGPSYSNSSYGGGGGIASYLINDGDIPGFEIYAGGGGGGGADGGRSGGDGGVFPGNTYDGGSGGNSEYGSIGSGGLGGKNKAPEGAVFSVANNGGDGSGYFFSTSGDPGSIVITY